MSKRKSKYPSARKAGKILKDDEARGHELTEAQRGLMGLLAGGGTPNPRMMKGKKRGSAKKSSRKR
jgi:hypothetical protein